LHAGAESIPPGRALVLGLARSGLAAAAALERRGIEVVRADRSLGNDEDASLLDGVGLVVKSPGVPKEHPLVAAARVPVWGEVELAARLLPARLVGVTGTNGKTTTSELLGAMLDARVAGNVGRALSELDGEVAEGELVVVELSSFQLEDIDELRCAAAILLNLEPDHLDRHGSFEAYRDAKLRVFENQGTADVAVVPRGFGPVPGEARRVEFDADDPLPAEPRLRGRHNRENAAAATAAARALGVPDERIAEALRTFVGVEHRLEEVATVDGVLYVNDSKATNVGAALVALAAIDAPIVLVAGGRGKGESFAPLADAAAGRVKAAVLIGETASELAAELSRAGVAHEGAESLEQALAAASRRAEPGDVVLLSPAAASFDQFRDFEHRGQEFKRLVRTRLG
jgi:UDP-N-acetylmuramoylalanine--D-glutamate ligase